MLKQFRREAIRSLADPSHLPDMGEPFELLARHHGVPSPILDWTESPYIAAFFAFDGIDLPKSGRRIAIWMLDRAMMGMESGDYDLIDDWELLTNNRRARQQLGAFLRINTIDHPPETMLDKSLTKIEIPSGQTTVALADLDAMNVNSASLFADLDGAARTATRRTVR